MVIVTERYKLAHFYGTEVDYWELFDLVKDPLEMRSVFGQPEYFETRTKLESELRRLRVALRVPDKTPPEWFGGPRDGKKISPVLPPSAAK